MMYGEASMKHDALHPKTTNGNDASHSPSPQVKLRILKEAFWVRVFLFADMGFAEACMLGEVECDDLTGFFKVCNTCLVGPKAHLVISSSLQIALSWPMPPH